MNLKIKTQPKIDQKSLNAQKQREEHFQAKAAAARMARLSSHNHWPEVTLTQAELEFQKLLADRPFSKLLQPYKFQDHPDRNFHRHLGMLIDGLEMLPWRPDHAFDFFFRTVDELSQQLTGKNKMTDAIEGLGPWVCNNLASHTQWKFFINLFSARLPSSTAKFMAQRLLDSFDTEGDPIRPRAKKLLSQTRYGEFHQKFKARHVAVGAKDVAAGANNAGIFIQLLLGLRVPTDKPDKTGEFPTLDLSIAKNVFDEPHAMWALVSLMAFTSRNERVHGSSLSPFRSSKASLTTYGSYYFEMLFVYTLAVGLMIELFEGCGDHTIWLNDMNANIARLDDIFGSAIK